MKTKLSLQERDAFAKAVSAVEGITFTKEDDTFFQTVLTFEEPTDAIILRVLERALAKA